MLVALSLSFLFVKGTTSYTDGRAHTEVSYSRTPEIIPGEKKKSFIRCD